MGSVIVRQLVHLVGFGLMVFCFNSWLFASEGFLLLVMYLAIWSLLIFWHTELSLIGFLQSSLAAARADNFYYPPEWEPSQVCLRNGLEALL